MDRARHRARRLASGSYEYRGWTIERLPNSRPGNGYSVEAWFATAPGQRTPDEAYSSLREAREMIDDYCGQGEAVDREQYRVERREVERDRRSSAVRMARGNERVREVRWYVVRVADGREVGSRSRRSDAIRLMRRLQSANSYTEEC